MMLLSLERPLKRMLTQFREAGLKLKPEKCTFYQKEVKFLGYLVSAEGVEPDPENISKVVTWPTPMWQSEVWTFLELGNY